MNILEQYGPLGLFFAFAIAHAIADYPLQGEYLARTKARGGSSVPGEWVVSLTVHSLIQAGAIWLVSGSALLGAIEFTVHWVIDLGKGERKYGLLADQVLHLATKGVYVGLMAGGVVS